MKINLPKKQLKEKWSKRGMNRLNKELEWLNYQIEDASAKLDLYKRWKQCLESFIKAR